MELFRYIFGDFWGGVIFLVFFIFLTYLYRKPLKMMIVKNTDYEGKSYSWKSTILGLIFLVIAIPIAIVLVVYFLYEV